MKHVASYTIRATAKSDGTKKSERAIEMQVKTALKAIAVEGVKLTIKKNLY